MAAINLEQVKHYLMGLQNQIIDGLGVLEKKPFEQNIRKIYLYPYFKFKTISTYLKLNYPQKTNLKINFLTVIINDWSY